MHRFTRSLKLAPVALLGVVAAVGAASLSQAQSGSGTTATTTTATTTTTTTPTTTTTTTPKAVVKPKPKPKPKPKATTKQVTCTARLSAVQPPIDNAENYGTLKCSLPFGKGVQHDTSTVTRSSKTEGSFAGPFKLFFNTGTLRGTFKMTFKVASGTASYEGSMKVSSGTGDFKGVKGSGTLTGSSTDLIHTSLTEKLTLTIPPPR